MKKTHIIILLCAFCISVSIAQSIEQSIPLSIPKESIYFDFRYNTEFESSVLKLSVNDNQLCFDRLNVSIKSNDTKYKILTHSKHISLVSCIMHMDINEAETINRASEQASVVRALLKTKFGIPHDCVSFSIDTTQGRRNRVYLNIFDGDNPRGDASNEIKYVQRGNRNKIFDLYQSGIPYGNYWMILFRYRKQTNPTL